MSFGDRGPRFSARGRCRPRDRGTLQQRSERPREHRFRIPIVTGSVARAWPPSSGDQSLSKWQCDRRSSFRGGERKRLREEVGWVPPGVRGRAWRKRSRGGHHIYMRGRCRDCLMSGMRFRAARRSCIGIGIRSPEPSGGRSRVRAGAGQWDARRVGMSRLRVCLRRSIRLARLRYGAAYDNTQTSSPAFERYVEGLADRLIEQAGSDGLRIIEIGCGKGKSFAPGCCAVRRARVWV